MPLQLDNDDQVFALILGSIKVEPPALCVCTNELLPQGFPLVGNSWFTKSRPPLRDLAGLDCGELVLRGCSFGKLFTDRTTFPRQRLFRRRRIGSGAQPYVFRKVPTHSRTPHLASGTLRPEPRMQPKQKGAPLYRITPFVKTRYSIHHLMYHYIYYLTE